MPVRATRSAIVPDHPLGMAHKLGRDLDLHPQEAIKVTAALIAKTLGLEKMDKPRTVRPVLVVARRKWTWISRKTPTRMRWRR